MNGTIETLGPDKLKASLVLQRPICDTYVEYTLLQWHMHRPVEKFRRAVGILVNRRDETYRTNAIQGKEGNFFCGEHGHRPGALPYSAILCLRYPLVSISPRAAFRRPCLSKYGNSASSRRVEYQPITTGWLELAIAQYSTLRELLVVNYIADDQFIALPPFVSSNGRCRKEAKDVTCLSRTAPEMQGLVCR